MAETKQILIDKAREVGFEYEAVGKHDFGDMDHFKEAMAQKKEAFDKEINEYKQEKQEEISKLEAEINDKQKQAQNRQRPQRKQIRLQRGYESKDRDKQGKSSISSANAWPYAERLRKQKPKKKRRRATPWAFRKIADQTLELEAKEEKELIEADKSFFKEQVQGKYLED